MSNEAERREAPSTPAGAADATLPRVNEVLAQLAVTANASAAFGLAQTAGNRTIIPAAEVMQAFGFGMGGGDSRTEAGSPASGRGAGGGGAARSRPVAAIVVEPDRVYVQPVVDATQLGLAALSAGVFTLFWVIRLLGRRCGSSRELQHPPSPKRLAKMLQH